MSNIPPITPDLPGGYIRWTNLNFIVGLFIACARERYGSWLGWWVRPRPPTRQPGGPTKENNIAKLKNNRGNGGAGGLQSIDRAARAEEEPVFNRSIRFSNKNAIYY